MELMVFKVCAEERGLCARVCEGYADITGDWGLVLLYTQLCGALLEHNLKQGESSYSVHMIRHFLCFAVGQCSINGNAQCVSHRVIVADEDQVLVLAASYCAFVQRVNNAHICLLLEAQQAVLVELHTVAPIGTNTDHCPYYQSDLRDSSFVIYISSRHTWCPICVDSLQII